jgi:hypothetical protein
VYVWEVEGASVWGVDGVCVCVYVQVCVSVCKCITVFVLLSVEKSRREEDRHAHLFPSIVQVVQLHVR